MTPATPPRIARRLLGLALATALAAAGLGCETSGDGGCDPYACDDRCRELGHPGGLCGALACTCIDGPADGGDEAGADAVDGRDVRDDAGLEAPAEASADDAGEGDVEPDDAGEGPPPEYCDTDDAHRYACCVFEEVNAYRRLHGEGLADYVWDKSIGECAFYYAGYLAEHGVFAHGADGQSFGDRLDSFDVAWTSAGENLQRNSLAGWTAACGETVWGHGGWAESTDGHREAMLGQDPSGVPKDWTHAAAGVARAAGEWYVAMYFVRY